MSKTEYKKYLDMAKYGHYPLFFNHWMEESLETKQNTNIRKATHNVRQVFSMLSRHKTPERKKTALLSMDRVSREEFVRSFFKIVEHDILQENRTLQ